MGMMDDLLVQARTQAERSSPRIRAAARMRIARVESAADPGQARITFEMALDEIRQLPGRERQILFELAQQTAAAFAPDLLREIPPVRRFPSDRHADTLLGIMLEHSLIAAAFDFIVQIKVPFGFPFHQAANLMRKLDEERQLTVLRCAVEAWRAPQDVELMLKHNIPQEDRYSSVIRLGHLQRHFIRLFRWQWQLIPSDDALAIVREIVRIALEQPDLGTSAGYPDVRITSSREHVLFEVLHILRRLDSSLADSLIEDHEQLAVAARRYPNGIESMYQEFEQQGEERCRRMAVSGELCDGFFMAGDPSSFVRQMALRQSSLDGDFGPAIGEASGLYREDTDPKSPNQALKALWPSTCSYRTTLYTAGKRLGADASTLLDQVPDPDLRLFAQIELSAALAGLPAWHETSIKQRNSPLLQGRSMRPSGGPG
jgi:hypothetical protein